MEGSHALASRHASLLDRFSSVMLVLSRLAHLNILWADEDYHLAGAIQVLWGKFPYRDFWYDKPPLNLAWFLLFDARTGVPLRMAGALFDVACCAGLSFRASGVGSRGGLCRRRPACLLPDFLFAAGSDSTGTDSLRCSRLISAQSIWHGGAGRWRLAWLRASHF